KHERNASRGPARAAELLRRAAHRLAGFFRIHHMADPARAATCNTAVRAGVASCDGPEPDRRLAAETPRTALRGCRPGDACADYCDDDHHPVCHSAVEPTTAGTHAQHAKYVARLSHSNQMAKKKLSKSSRGVAGPRRDREQSCRSRRNDRKYFAQIDTWTGRRRRPRSTRNLTL